MEIWAKRINFTLASKWFFRATLGFFLLESAWIALSAAYPQAFDEGFHFGLIQVYSHHWLPFLSQQPPHADAYGAVARDPSYLYHYLMSFPYRVIQLFTPNFEVQVIVLRFINIILMLSGMVLFRKVLLRAGTSKALTHTSLLIFVLIPIVPQLAGQINYDNLLIPLVALACLLTMQVDSQLTGGKLSSKSLIILLIVCFLATLVQYEFAPIFLAIIIFLAFRARRHLRGKGRKLLATFGSSWQKQPRISRYALVALLVISVGLFAQRDGYNLVKYHSFAPNCSRILSVRACSHYSAWDYSYKEHQKTLKLNKTGNVSFDNPVTYTGLWIYWLWYRLFFAVNGPADGFRNYPPLPLPALAAGLIFLSGSVVLIWSWRRHFQANPYLSFFGLASFIFLAALWLSGFSAYHYTHILQMMNGRYILPILPLLAAIIGVPLAGLLRRRSVLKLALTTVVLVAFLEGGGVFTFIMRSDSKWDWHNTTAIKANDDAREVLSYVIIRGKKTYGTNLWFFNL